MSDSDAARAGRGGWRRFVTVITGIEIGIGVVALVVILGAVFLQAVQRYLPVESAAWTGEIARFALIWLTFATMGVLVTTRGHIALEIVDSIPRRQVVRWVQVFALVVVAATGAGLVYEAVALLQSQQIVKSPVLRMPMSLVYVPVLVGVVSTTVRSTVAAVLIARNGPLMPDYDNDADAAGVTAA
ncbi:TRAP transporter small permease [Microbacterium marinilacus]|uniref:Tripartite ATP-independent periplasmic transporters DctQ component domain-containing protein n=1 Tax=Microbacterium marinilacus TaxID=415209 RepID=A0ABP7BV49_9MICO|nr:TRAP transporter small permease subunit [Microbacterium marinilacus]MBY0689198.1 TRAP transporter small permease subunit [Microbacterium marinilacus]